MATYPAASVLYVHPPGSAKGWGRNRSPRIRPYPMSLSAFADLRFTIEDLVAEGDKVVACFSMSATHRGELWGHPQRASN